MFELNRSYSSYSRTTYCWWKWIYWTR